MTQPVFLFAAAFALCLVTEAAFAQSLRDARARDAAETALAEQAVYTGKVCSADIQTAVEWTEGALMSADALIADCDKSLGAVEAVCRGGRKAPVDRFICASDGRGAVLKGRTLRYGAGPDRDPFAETQAVLSTSR